MKKSLFIFSLISIFSAVTLFAQDSTQQNRLNQLLSEYYGLKDALVAGNAETAAGKAGEFVKTLNGIDYKIISEGNANALLKDAGSISETKDIKLQRQYFSNFSNNMYSLAKSVKLTVTPIYQQYCPMKKMYWLSNASEIRNPYYGSAMLTCGKVTDTLE